MFVTVDRNLSFQQSLSDINIAVIVLRAPTDRLKDLRLLVPRLAQMLPLVPKGEVRWVSL